MLRPCICVPWSVVPSLQWLFVYYIFAVFPWAGSAARIARLGRVKRGSQHRDPGAGTGGEQGGAIINIYTLPPLLTGSPSLVPMVTTPHLVMVTTVSAAMAPHLPR